LENNNKPVSNIQEKAQVALKKIINFIVNDGEVQIIDNEKNDNVVALGITTSNPAILIGRHGYTLDSIQHIINIMINKESKKNERKKIIIDIENYRSRRKDIVSKYACEKADIVKKSAKKITLCPMNAIERRIVHLVLKEDPMVITYSEGTEPFRRVIIAPREKENNIDEL